MPSLLVAKLWPLVSEHEAAMDSRMQNADCRMIEVNACVAGERMPPPGWTTTDPNVEAASPLQLSRREEGRCH